MQWKNCHKLTPLNNTKIHTNLSMDNLQSKTFTKKNIAPIYIYIY